MQVDLMPAVVACNAGVCVEAPPEQVVIAAGNGEPIVEPR